MPVQYDNFFNHASQKNAYSRTDQENWNTALKHSTVTKIFENLIFCVFWGRGFYAEVDFGVARDVTICAMNKTLGSLPEVVWYETQSRSLCLDILDHPTAPQPPRRNSESTVVLKAQERRKLCSVQLKIEKTLR